MPLTRTHFRNKSRSPAPTAVEFISASRTPVFLPPAHYAAAAGLDYRAMMHARGEGNSPRPTQDLQPTAYTGPNSASPLLQTRQDDTATRVNPASGFNRVSRFIARSPSLGKASAARRASKAIEKEKTAEETKRTSCMADLPFVELQLIPTLRDTIDKMTHPPTPIATHEEEFDGAIENARVRAYHDADSNQSSGESQVSSCSSATSSTRPSTTRTDSLHQYPLLQPPKPTKSALRSPSPGKRPFNDTEPVPSPSSLRKSRAPAPRDVPLVIASGSTPKATNQVTPGASRIPGVPSARSRFTKNPPPTDLPAPNSRLPVARPQTSAGFGFGFGYGFKPSTPQPPPALRSGFPAFKTPQPVQGPFAQRHQTNLPRPARAGGIESKNSVPRSTLPRPVRRSDHERDSGSELERRVNPGLGRLVVANAQIVPSSSEESAREERGEPQSMWGSAGAFQALARKTATRVPSPQRRPRPQHLPQLQQAWMRDPRTVDARKGEMTRRDSRASVGLGLDMDSRMEMGGRYDLGDADESVYDDDDGGAEEDTYSSGGSNGEHRDPQRPRYEDIERRRGATPESPDKRQNYAPRDFETSVDRRKRLSGIVDGLQASYGAHRSPGKSILSQSESDVYYEQGLAIGTSSDIPNSSMGDVSLHTSHRSHRQDEQDGEDEDEEQSNYSETEDSFSIVVDDAEAERAQPGSPWWMRGRSSTIPEGAVEHSEEPEVQVAALRRLSGTNNARTPRIEEQTSAQVSADARSASKQSARASSSAGTRLSQVSTGTEYATGSKTRDWRRMSMVVSDEHAPSTGATASRSPRHPPQDEKASRRMTMAFKDRLVHKPTSRRSSILEEDTDRTPRVSGQETPFFASATYDSEEAVASDDCADRECEAYGIPRSLSFGAGHTASDSESSGGPAAGRPRALLRSESDESLPGGPASMTRESSYMANVWRESRNGKDLLSKGAHELFAGLVDQSREEDAFDYERPAERRERPPSRQDRERAGSKPRAERPRSREEHRPSRTQDEDSRPKKSCRHSRHTETRQDPGSKRWCVPDNQEQEAHPTRLSAPYREQAPQTGPVGPGQSASAQTSWQATVHPDIYEDLLARHGPMEMQRQEVIYELLQTEREFVQHLRAITSAFVLPLRVHASKAWLPGVPAQISRLFDWLEDILNLHTTFMHTLKDASRAWQAGAIVIDVGKDLLPLVPRLEVHQPYLVRVDQARELVALWVQDGDSQFGEYVRMREEEGVCDGWCLEQCLQSPVQRLGSYLSIFSRLLDSTHRQHTDYLSTLSLLRSVNMSVRVMEEVRIREEEYDFVKDVAMHILGSDGAAQLATRERRLLYQGALHYLLASTPRNDVESEAVHPMPTVQINGLPVHDPADEKQDRAERGRRLASAIHNWHVRRARSGSVSSSASSSLSLWSHDSLASNVTPNTPMSDVHTPLPDTSVPETVQAFVFTDLILLAVPTQLDQNRRSEWRLLDNVGLSRVLDIRINKNNEAWDRTLILDLIPLDMQELSLSLHSRAGVVVELLLQFPSQDSSSERDWLVALQRSRAATLHSLSFPPPSPEDVLHGPVGDYEQDTYHCVKSILASGLPMPKSPSMQLDVCDLQTQPGADTNLEREERGWWSLRFHQVSREFQRQHLDSDTPNGAHT